MELLKEINLYNMFKVLVVLLVFVVIPLIIVEKLIKKYVKSPISKLVKAFNIL